MSKIVVDNIEDLTTSKNHDVDTLFANTSNSIFNGDMKISSKLGIGGSFDPPTNLTVYGSSSGGISTLTDNTSIVIDMTANNNFKITLGGSNTFINPTALTEGQSGAIWITQDGTGSRAPSWGSYWKFPANTAPTLTTTASATDLVVYVVESTTSISAVAILNV